MAAATLTRLTGICPAARAFALARVVAARPAAVWLVVTEEARDLEALAEDLAVFAAADGPAPAPEILVLPEVLADSREAREAFQTSSDRLTVLSRLHSLRTPGSSTGSLLVVATPGALVQPVPPPEDFAAREVTLRPGPGRPFAEVVALLRQFDYDSEAVCEAPGQYAVRGGIIDLYPVTARQPYRLDFCGDELESIRALDPVTQRSGEAVAALALTAAPPAAGTASPGSFLDYLPAGTQAALLEPTALEEAFDLLDSATGDARALARLPTAVSRLVGVGDLDLASALFDRAVEEETWDTEPLEAHRSRPEENLLAHERLESEDRARRRFLEQVLAWQAEGYAVDLVVAQPGEEQRTRELLEEDAELRALRPRYLRGAVNAGFRVTWRGAEGAVGRGRVVVTETEIFGRRRTRRAAARRAVATPSAVDQLLDFSELVEGDFVVHLQHGIALYRGLTRLESLDGVREVISLEFDDRVTLHVPLQESHLVSRYVGLAKVRPQLGRVGSGRWERTRAAAERATLDLAAELLRIQAQREAQPGHAFPPDNAWQREFEAGFPFTETPDQAKAIAAAKADMERTRPMDRLVCGDVGFGKTEVAIRAAFKAVMGGRQVAVLVPTTVLAQQHLNTFRERMAGYPIAVEMVSRFRSRADQRRILAALEAGQVDVLIGTHRLLQADVRFRDLGLVVIDEEQRFGVKHKEVFKRWRAHVDLISMSATPIPRTLYLALTGARDLSTIETPPTDRLPIQTVVKTYDEKLVVEAIQHEVRRGGQVFYLHNRVQTIDLVAARLRELLPGLRIGVGHGKMNEDELERTMTDFVAGQHQVLVCTTIIESGLDIPNCNTIIIEGADRFGLSQLYQLRGRVGRFRHQAYAYLLLHRHARVLDLARQRLGALRQHNQLGAGFRIAMRDLELRGAGNLLGSEQSGHIVGVGFELYCQLLRQSVARLRGDTHAATVRAAVKLDFVFVGESAGAAASPPARAGATDSFSALREAERAATTGDRLQARLPTAYVGETRLRIDFYRRLALADSVAAVRALAEEMVDRFGPPPPEAETLLLVTEIRVRAEQKGLLSVETDAGRLKCLRRSGRPDDYIQYHGRFPRLTAPTPAATLREVITFLQNLPNP